jgi:Eukaryotic translation initiation factor 4E binding protein (EIF4EBP)
MRNSPLARTPPKNLPVIPGITTDAPAQVVPKSPLRSSLVKTGKKKFNIVYFP